jgi:hypothetical protein
MSAAAFPYGMVPVENYGAGYNTQGFETVTILDGYATSIFFGDVVKLAADGTLQKDTGTTTLTPFGIFLGCRYINPTLGYVLDAQCWPASTTTGNTVYAKVLTNPMALFKIQANGSVALTARGDNAAIVQTAGSTTYPQNSANALNASSINTTNTLPLRIWDVWDAPGNAWGDAFTEVLVSFNNNTAFFTATGV